jgi:hypothetical protein
MGDELRIETRTPAGAVVTLVDHKNQRLATLDPSTRTYSEVQIPDGFRQLFGVISFNHEPPCLRASAPGCMAMGDAMVNGRLVRHWLRTVGPEGARQQWVDVERGWVLQSQSPGLNGLMTLRYLGLETLEGRLVEKWERQQSFARRPTELSWFWYDPELALGVREEWPGGHVQRVSHIRPGLQPSWLFRVPAEYQRVWRRPAGASAGESSSQTAGESSSPFHAVQSEQK